MIRIDALAGPEQATTCDGWAHHRWLLRLSSPHGVMTTVWRQAGPVPAPTHPSMAGPILDALAAEAAPYLLAGSFEEFCADLDPDLPEADPGRAWAAWEAAHDLAEGLLRLLGSPEGLARAAGVQRPA